MKHADKKAGYQQTMDRLKHVGLVAPVLSEARDIEAITTEILGLKKTAGEAILTIGQRLIEAKELLPHGEWISWLNEKVDFSERAARNFMRLAREWTNRQTLADLGASKALVLLALPEPERETFIAETHAVNGQEKTVSDMSTRELEKVIRERDAVKESNEKMAEDLKLANELLARAKSEKSQTDAAIAELERQVTELKSRPVETVVIEKPDRQVKPVNEDVAVAKAIFERIMEDSGKLKSILDRLLAADDNSNAESLQRLMRALSEKIEKDAT